MGGSCFNSLARENKTPLCQKMRSGYQSRNLTPGCQLGHLIQFWWNDEKIFQVHDNSGGSTSMSLCISFRYFARKFVVLSWRILVEPASLQIRKAGWSIGHHMDMWTAGCQQANRSIGAHGHGSWTCTQSRIHAPRQGSSSRCWMHPSCEQAP